VSFVYRLLFAIIYLVGCCFFGVALLGGGHGTLVFMEPLPTILAFVAAILMLGRASRSRSRILVVGLVIFHYVSTFIITFLVESGDGFAHTLSLLETSTKAFVLPTVWYASGQIFFWFMFFRTRSEPEGVL